MSVLPSSGVAARGDAGAGTPFGEGWVTEPDAEAASRTDEALPPAVSLEALFPNPAQGAAPVAFALPKASPVRLAVYDVPGREVAVLVGGEVEADRHAARLDAQVLPAGAYLVRLGAGDRVETQRLTPVR